MAHRLLIIELIGMATNVLLVLFFIGFSQENILHLSYKCVKESTDNFIHSVAVDSDKNKFFYAIHSSFDGPTVSIFRVSFDCSMKVVCVNDSSVNINFVSVSSQNKCDYIEFIGSMSLKSIWSLEKEQYSSIKSLENIKFDHKVLDNNGTNDLFELVMHYSVGLESYVDLKISINSTMFRTSNLPDTFLGTLKVVGFEINADSSILANFLIRKWEQTNSSSSLQSSSIIDDHYFPGIFSFTQLSNLNSKFIFYNGAFSEEDLDRKSQIHANGSITELNQPVCGSSMTTQFVRFEQFNLTKDSCLNIHFISLNEDNSFHKTKFHTWAFTYGSSDTILNEWSIGLIMIIVVCYILPVISVIIWIFVIAKQLVSRFSTKRPILEGYEPIPQD